VNFFFEGFRSTLKERKKERFEQLAVVPTPGQRWSFPSPFGEWHSQMVKESLRVRPVNSHSHSHSLKIPLGGGGQHPVTIFPPKKTPTHTVTEIRCHYSNGGMGCGLGSSLFSPKKKLILERLEHLKKLGFFDANCLSDSLAIPKKKLRLRAKFFRIPHSLSHSLKVLRKKNESFLDSHSLRI